MGVHEDLVATRNLLDQSGWIRGRSRATRIVFTPRPRKTMAYCLWGALVESSGPGRALGLSHVLCRLIRSRGISDAATIGFNDDYARSKQDVLDLLDEAIALTAPSPEDVELRTCVDVPTPELEEKIPLHA